MKNSKKLGSLAFGLAAAAIAVMPLKANAQTDNWSSSSVSAPTQVTGTVVRYYVNSLGYVTAVDIQTNNGIQLVRFSPSLGQRLYTTYPVGSTASVFVTGSEAGGWNVVGIGNTAPASNMVGVVSDVDLLETEPYVLGSKMVTRKGKLRNLVLSRSGEIIGIVLDDNTLVRTPREARNIAPGYHGSDRVAGLFKGAWVEATGYPEAPRYGTLSLFSERIAANVLVINGHSVGAIGLPRLDPVESKSLLNWNIGGADQTAEEIRASRSGYITYTPATTMQ